MDTVIDRTAVLDAIDAFVKIELQRGDGGHNWDHIERVEHLAMEIVADENRDASADVVDPFLVRAGVKLHEIGDRKLYPEGKLYAYRNLEEFLERLIGIDMARRIIETIRYVSYSENIGLSHELSMETKIIQDADKLEAMGALGILRAAHYGGHHNRQIYDPSVTPRLEMSREEYLSHETTTVNHIPEKLLKLYDQLWTRKGRELGWPLHCFMEAFYKQFLLEMNSRS